MNSEGDPQAWVAKAEEDFSMSRILLRRKRPLTSGVCFHAQQCAEKYLKALLIAHAQPFPRTHDLRILSNLCEQAGMSIGTDLNRIDTLSFYAVQARYPGDEPTPEEASESFEIVKDVRHVARSVAIVYSFRQAYGKWFVCSTNS